ncbi:MAG: C4-type zinc ribbon domain-containing protein [Desulfuromonadaceae bacterium]|nr:C4-type zinc ribbon domain-containing protein [Desulfuromonadaceae bacterium]
MKEEVQQLIDVQELDQKILEARKKRCELMARKEKLLAQVEKLEAVVNAFQEQIDEVQQDVASLNQDLSQELDNVTKAENRLPEVKTQKEYLAILKEVDAAKKNTKDIEDALKLKLDLRTELEADRDDKQSELDELNKESASQLKDIKTLVAEMEQIDTKNTPKRDKLITQVPETLGKRYELVLSRLNSVALVEAKNYTCTGCHMRLPPQFFNNMLKSKSISTCPQCNRLLYIEDV